MALKEHCRERICFMIPVCFLGSLLVASPASCCCNTCQFPSSQLCNARNFLQHSRILQHPLPTTLRAFSVSSSDCTAVLGSQQLPCQHLLSTSFAKVCLQWEISPWADFSGTIEGEFPAGYREHIFRKFPHEAS